MKKFLALALLICTVCSGNSYAAARKSRKTVVMPPSRNIPTSPILPPYQNPAEIDLKHGTLHISLKGAFRAADSYGRPTDWIYLAFTAASQEDMPLTVSQSDLFDSHARAYKYRAVPKIGHEHTFRRELIAGVAVPVLVGAYVPVSEAGELPSISRITITFNGESFQFRNIASEEWQTWEELKQGLGFQD